ncbi:MAG: sulfatase [Candidatus Hydrogenedentes bacterium]|nr:sulfatase [Candidatus Hydrogenedentota bacterium]
MTRNSRLTRACRMATVVAWILVSTVAHSAETAEAKRPLNVLFIAIDDLNDWPGFLGGNPQVKTPNLDRLAAQGTAFTRAYCASPLCNPSRTALMTGILPSRSGVYENNQDWRTSPMLQQAVTLPQHFMANGYTAMGSGKIYHGRYPHAASWDAFWPSQERNSPKDPEPPQIPWKAGAAAVTHFDWGPLDVADSDMGDGQVVEWVGKQLAAPQDKPFFLACGLFKPHLPWYVPQKYFDMYPLDEIELPRVKAGDLDDVPPLGRAAAKPNGDHKRVLETGKWKEAVQAYMASIAFTDACIGQLLDAVAASPHRDNTLIVLWSDHGWHLGEKEHWRKFTLWEEATRNLLVFAGAGITPGQRCDVPVGLIDIYPTLTELCGLPAREGIDGLSLVPQLRDPSATRERPALTTFGYNNHAVRTAKWRYIRYSDGTEELYDHDNDEMEWTNLAGDAQYAALKDELGRWMPKENVQPIARADVKEQGQE